MPSKDNFNTSFSIDYRTDGAKDEAAAVFAEISAHRERVAAGLLATGSGGMGTGAVIGIIAGSVVLILVCGFVIRAMMMKRDEDKVTMLSAQVGAGDQMTPMKPSKLPNKSTVDQTQANESEDYHENDIVIPEGKNKYLEKAKMTDAVEDRLTKDYEDQLAAIGQIEVKNKK